MRLRRLLPMLVLLGLSACDQQQPSGPSVTIRLPPARPAAAKPGFTFGADASPVEVTGA